MNKRIAFENLGGNPLDQQSWEFMQDSYRSALAAVAKLCGDKTILTGVEVAGGNVTPGWISYNGELVRFVGGAVSAEVVVVETSNLVSYNDGSQYQVEFEKVAYCGAPGAFLLSDLKPLSTILGIKTALETLAQLFATHTHTYASLTDKPAAYIGYSGSFLITDGIAAAGVSTTINVYEAMYTVPIPDQGGTPYKVFITMVGLSADPTTDNDILYIVRNLQPNYFQVVIREIAATYQLIRIDYLIVKS